MNPADSPDKAEGPDGASPSADAAPAGAGSAAEEPEPQHPARELSVHLLRMMETRMEAAAIAVQGETRRFVSRLQWQLVAAAGIFFAVWAGIVLLAIALPEHLRVPVLAAVVGGFVLLAIGAIVYARRMATFEGAGSIRWFLDCLRQDLEMVSRLLSRQPPRPKPDSSSDRSPPHDLAA